MNRFWAILLMFVYCSCVPSGGGGKVSVRLSPEAMRVHPTATPVITPTPVPHQSASWDATWLQTAERGRFARFTSLDMGENDVSFYHLNLRQNVMPDTCDDLVNDYPAATYGMPDVNGNMPTDFSTLALGDTLRIELSAHNGILYGDNLLVGLFADLRAGVGNPEYVCPSHTVRLWDFTYLDTSMVDGLGNTRLEGSLVSYGVMNYGGTENQVLENGLINIVK